MAQHDITGDEAWDRFNEFGSVKKWLIQNGWHATYIGLGQYLFWCPVHNRPHIDTKHGYGHRLDCPNCIEAKSACIPIRLRAA